MLSAYTSLEVSNESRSEDPRLVNQLHETKKKTRLQVITGKVATRPQAPQSPRIGLDATRNDPDKYHNAY